uniref:Uncharacterized protein LOC116942523 isoform X4 n=1 Tax=Petromyzon marinus TaxID=7757 RepID=A0AAJ7WVQ4_PETMA|nr:uncharacterized protein LOC116942523 isoform X4 [Petromyzon marinus]
MACAAVLEPNRDFPAWLEAQGVNAEVARAMDSELGIRDYGVLRACVGDGLVRAELLAAARDRLPFGFYAVLRQVVKALRGAEPHDAAGTPRWDEDDAAAASSPGDVTLGGLVDVLLALFSGLSRELLLSARRLGAMDGAGTCAGGSSPGGVEEAAMVEQHLNCTENEEIGDIAPSIIDDFGQNKMMRIIKMEDHEDGDNGGEGSVDENDDGGGGGGWRSQEGAEGMAASCMDGPGNRAESHWGFVIERVTSLQDAKAQRRACAQRPGTVAPPSPSPPPPPPPPPPPQKRSKPGSVKIKSEAKDWTTATIDASATAVTTTSSTAAAATTIATATTASNTSRAAATPATIASAATAVTVATRADKRAPWQVGKEREDFAPQRKRQQQQQQPQPRTIRLIPYKCNVCGQMFLKQLHLRKHLQKHDAERPNRCDLCGSAFRYLSDLMCHWQTHVPQAL